MDLSNVEHMIGMQTKYIDWGHANLQPLVVGLIIVFVYTKAFRLKTWKSLPVTKVSFENKTIQITFYSVRV